jgi:hypothetical protein
MQPVVRNVSVWAFSALFGCISLFGPGWHRFAGHHFHGASALCSHGCDAHSGPESTTEHCAAADHFTCHDADDHAGDNHEGAWPAAGAIEATASDRDCPICSFFGQAQWVAAFELAEFASGVFEVSTEAQQAPFLAWLGIYRTRAPPIVWATC